MDNKSKIESKEDASTITFSQAKAEKFENISDIFSLNRETIAQALKDTVPAYRNCDNDKILADIDSIIRLQNRYLKLQSESDNLRRTLQFTADKAASYDIIRGSFFWNITYPLRKGIDLLKYVLRDCRIAHTIWYFLKRTKNSLLQILGVVNQSGYYISFDSFAKADLFSEKDLQKQREEVFPRKIKFSIIVPLYNTDAEYLREMISSVQAQTYQNWELCLADGSDVEHFYVGKICKSFVQKDSRILYHKLDSNLGISDNTNASLKMSSGDYLGLLDHDDRLHPSALFEVMRTICNHDADFIYTDEAVFDSTLKNIRSIHFKPDYAPDTLRSVNYICHFSVFSRVLLEKTGYFHSEYDGSQDHDFILRATGSADCVAHIPEVLYFWRSHPGSVAYGIGEKGYAADAGRSAVKNYVKSLGNDAEVTSTESCASYYHIRYELKQHPKVSILILNRDHLKDLKRCISSIFTRSTYDHYEIIIVENNSTSSDLFTYYEDLQNSYKNVKVITYNGAFNYSAISNYGVRACTGEILLLLNNDTEVISPEWMEEMLMYACRKDVGAVGAKLYFPDGNLQHAGVLLGVNNSAHHYYYDEDSMNTGYMGRLSYVQNLTAVTGACLMLRREVWDEVNGLEESLAVEFNDVDLCMKLRAAGYLNVWTPFAELYHYESLSRGQTDTEEKLNRRIVEMETFQKRWSKELSYGDPYFNPNFHRDSINFSRLNSPQQYQARYSNFKV